jgi:lipopolysaccharide biosynthesis glycosyltransferase
MSMDEKIVLTVCTAAYLAQAKVLGDSLLKFNPGYKLVIGLVDKLDGRIDSDYWKPHELIEVHELNIPQFEKMYQQYTTLELVCAVKSFYTDRLFKLYNPGQVIFLDCDILILDSFAYLESELNNFSILLTAHITQPFPNDGRKPVEKTILKTGMFNAGFYGVSNDENGKNFISWWKERMVDQCYERPKEGLNADQKWLNFLPLYFKKVKILDHPGCNLAYWNFHERTIEKKQEKFFANNQPVIFFHYSGYSLNYPDLISRHQDRFNMKENAAVNELFSICRENLIQNRHEEIQKIPCYYQKSTGGFLKKLGLKK